MNSRDILILVVIILLVAVIFYFLFRVKTESFTTSPDQYVLINNIQCGKPKCDLIVKNIPVLPPPTNLADFNTNITFHQSLINFMATVIQASLSTNKTYIAPPGMTLVKQVDTPKDPLMGVLAVINSDPTTLIIAIRGTQTGIDLLQDSHLAQTPFPITSRNNPLVHQGFYNVYVSVKDIILQSIPKNIQNIIVVGHSLGSAVAVLMGLTIKQAMSNINTRVVTYACPKVGNEDLADLVDSNIEHVRIVNGSDAVPTLPGAVSPNQTNPPTPWFYYHSGTAVTFNLNWKSVINNHLIPVYMAFINS